MTLITFVFFVLAFYKELEYRYLNMLTNIGDDEATGLVYNNLVNFGSVNGD